VPNLPKQKVSEICSKMAGTGASKNEKENEV
jgi:hypothetical protein